MSQTNINIRMDDTLKQQFDHLCNELGTNMSVAINIFAKTMVRQQKIPFEVSLDVPNPETLAAIYDVNNERNLSCTFHSVNELMEDLNAWFKKDYKAIIKRGYNPQLLQDVLTILCNEQQLPPRYKNLNLSSNYEGHRECHIIPDWLLIYKINKNTLILTLTRTGTHSDLF